MTSTTNGAHIAVTLSTDPLTVVPDEPCHTGRYFASPIVREMLTALGIKVCADCHRFVAMASRTERPIRRKGSGWRERP